MEPRDIEKLKQRAGEAIERQGEALRQAALYLHDHPEVGWHETQAASRLTDFLAERGFAVERGVAGFSTAFRAVRRSSRPGPMIAFLAEYDALEGVGHGCGHHLIAGGALGAALGAAEALGELAGAVMVFGTPAEEFTNQLQGKIQLLRAGAFAGIDACLMFHPWIFSAPINSSLAFTAIDVTFHGRTAHAAADPWNGLNALDAVIMTFNGINALRQHIRPDVRIHGIITDGGVAPNIIPERAAARFMMRARKFDEVRRILERVRACAEGAALASGTKLELQVTCETADTVALPALQRLTRANFEALGLPFGPPADWTASTDFGDVSYRIPSESFFMSLGAGSLPWHSAEVVKAGAEEPALRAMLNAAKVLAMDGIDLLAQPEVLQEARRELPQA
jgi:amidohydrolase